MADAAHTYHTSRTKFSKHYLALVILLFASWVLRDMTGRDVVVPLATIAVLCIIGFEVATRLERLTLTAEGLIAHTGLLSRSTTRINYNRIAHLNVTQSFLQRLVGSGNIEIGVPGATLNQRVIHNFSGKGDVKLGPAHDLAPKQGVVLQNFQSIRRIEAAIASQTRGAPAQ